MPLLLNADDLRPLLTDSDAIEDSLAAIENAYREFHRGESRLFSTFGLELTGRQRSLRVCPGVAGAGVSLRTYPTLERDEFPDTAVNLLFDSANGRLLAVMAGDDINLFRTASPAALAARYLAPAAPRTLAVLGSGRQAHGFLPLLQHALPTLERARVYSPTREHREAYARKMADTIDLAVEAVDEPRLAVEGADVLAVVSSGRQPVLEADWVRHGALVISIASGQLPPDLISTSRVSVSARSEVVGDGVKREPYTSLAASGAWSPGRVVEMGEIVMGEVPGRVLEEETVIHEMPGLSFWDAAILSWVYDWAVRNRVGTSFNLSGG
jgi:alanine dehydrogenase